ncbi:MAG: amylo-alpha-1,6-glucosidase [Alphaproteobacteria bacterium]|nr:amylo-alpha-1,6-glucosidase [Alphaproteobacteria bacterium]
MDTATTPPHPKARADLDALDVPAESSLEEQKPRAMKHGDTFAVFDNSGDIVGAPGSPEGLFHADTRHLSQLRLTINGRPPMLLRSSMRDDNSALLCDLTNPDFHDSAGRVFLKHNRLHIRRVRVLWNGAACERISLRNFDTAPMEVSIVITFGADFADIFEVRGATRPRRGETAQPKLTPSDVSLRYTGLDHRLRETLVRFDPIPDKLESDRASYSIQLAPGETRVLFMDCLCDPVAATTAPRRKFFHAFMSAQRARRGNVARAASVRTSNDHLNEALERSVSDLFMLCTQTPHGLYPYAGIPWFSTIFGRDALITALQTLWFDPAIARGVLLYLAANQADAVDRTSDAEPGKILHEVRRSEMAELGEVPFRRYYGSVDSTPLFVMLAGAYLERTGDIETLGTIAPNILHALDWIDQYGDRDRDGFVEYHRQTESGLANQGWKDSHDSIFHQNGELAQSPIALVEVQAYVYGAWRSGAQIARVLGEAERARVLDIRADAFRRRFDTHFYDESIGTYVIALDAEKRPCRIRSSNAGHVLFTGLALPERAAKVGQTLMASFTGFGVRTVAASEQRYNPMSYHNGSIWPHDNAIVAAGLARYGLRQEAAQIFAGLFDASNYMELRRLPELFCGFPRQRGAGPVFYPVACSPQAWATAAPLMLIQACVGLSFSPEDKRINFDRPHLPSFLDEIVFKNLRVGNESADIALKRSHNGVALDVLRRTPGCKIVTTA